MCVNQRTLWGGNRTCWIFLCSSYSCKCLLSCSAPKQYKSWWFQAPGELSSMTQGRYVTTDLAQRPGERLCTSGLAEGSCVLQFIFKYSCYGSCVGHVPRRTCCFQIWFGAGTCVLKFFHLPRSVALHLTSEAKADGCSSETFGGTQTTGWLQGCSSYLCPCETGLGGSCLCSTKGHLNEMKFW